MDNESLAFKSVAEQARLIERREISPVDLVRLYLARIEKWDHVLHSWITVCGEQALKKAGLQQIIRREDVEHIRFLGEGECQIKIVAAVQMRGIAATFKPFPGKRTGNVRRAVSGTVFQNHHPIRTSGLFHQ